MPSFEYQFRLVDKTDFRAPGSGLVARSDVVIENKIVHGTDTGGNPIKESKDVYAELLKLDDLRKKGILTESEFQIQKERLLKSN